MPVQNKDSGLKSGSREIYLPQSFEAPNPVQGKIFYYKTLKLSISGLRISGSKKNLSLVKFVFSGKIKRTKESVTKHNSNIGTLL